MSTDSCTSPRPSWWILPTSIVTSAPSSSFFSRSALPSWRTISPRLGAGTSRQRRYASCAAATTCSYSLAPACLTVPSTSPVAGLRLSRIAPEVLSHLPA